MAIIKCTKCRSDASDRSLVCPRCREPLRPAANSFTRPYDEYSSPYTYQYPVQPISTPASRRKKSKAPLVAVLASFVAVASLVLVFFLLYNQAPQESLVRESPLPPPPDIYQTQPEQGIEEQEPPVQILELLAPEEIHELSINAAFEINTFDEQGRMFGQGSGFFVCETGVAVTAHHVIAAAHSAVIITDDERRFPIAGYYSYCETNDIAVIQIGGEGELFGYVEIDDSGDIRLGMDIFTIGTPAGFRNTFLSGQVSRIVDIEFGDGHTYRVRNALQISTPLSPGHSGGVLLNGQARAIGVAVAGHMLASQLSFAVPIRYADMSRAETGEYSPLPLGGTPSTPPSSPSPSPSPRPTPPPPTPSPSPSPLPPPSPSPLPPPPTPLEPPPERVTFLQSIGIPAGEGEVGLRVEVGGNTIFDGDVPSGSIFDIQITGYPDDLLRIYLDGELSHERTIAALIQP